MLSVAAFHARIAVLEVRAICCRPLGCEGGSRSRHGAVATTDLAGWERFRTAWYARTSTL